MLNCGVQYIMLAFPYDEINYTICVLYNSDVRTVSLL